MNVDMATYKAEFLSHHWEGRLRPRSAYAFGWIDKWAQAASVVPGFVNLCTQLPILRDVAKLAAGIPPERTIPAFAPETFQAWFRKRRETFARAGHQRVILWPDTFNDFFFPDTAIAAAEVLRAADFEVVVPNTHFCCGRPLYDYGFLGMASNTCGAFLLDLVRKSIGAHRLWCLSPAAVQFSETNSPIYFPVFREQKD